MLGHIRKDVPPGWRTAIPVLLYHGVTGDPPPMSAPLAVHPSDFERHLDAIDREGLETVTISGLLERLSGRHMPSTPLVAITFDDGFADVLDVAAPLLRKRRMVATAYLTTGYLARRNRQSSGAPGRMLSWERLEELEACGIEVGAHTHGHPQLDVLPRAAAVAEVRVSRILLEAHLGHRVNTFAYPYGFASAWLQGEVRRAGFESACGVRNALSHNKDNRWLIARLTLKANTPVDRVAAWLRGQGAPIAGQREKLQTRAWRGLRHLRYVSTHFTEPTVGGPH